MDPNEPVPTIVVDTRRPNVVYSGSARRGLFKTGNGGNTWQLHTDGLRTRSIVTLAHLGGEQARLHEACHHRRQ